jgi:ribonucleoside-diphosphate reductase beta chain
MYISAGGILEAGAQTLTAIAQREDFLATGDPALREEADTGRVELLDYTQLYELWERQQWATQDIDFARDRADWEGFSSDERYQRMYGLSAFFIGEPQIADEARHVRFFNRFYDEVGVLDGADDLAARLARVEANLNPEFEELFDGMLRGKVDRLAAEPSDTVTLVEAVTLYHMVIEGCLALTGQHFIISYNEEQGTLPGFVEGFGNVARDEHRHVAFGARFLGEMAATDERHRDAIQRTLAESLPVAEGVLRPPFAPEDDDDPGLFGVSMRETNEFAVRCLTRRLKVIGLA